jgi:hypothetical protein
MPKKISTPVGQLPVPVELVERRIYLIRGQKVMLDSDLAELYQVPTKVLNQAVAPQLQPVPQGLHVPAHRSGGRFFEVTNCDLKRYPH